MKKLVRETRAGFVVPVHTEHEELFQQWHGNLHTVSLKDTIEIKV